VRLRAGFSSGPWKGLSSTSYVRIEVTNLRRSFTHSNVEVIFGTMHLLFNSHRHQYPPSKSRAGLDYFSEEMKTKEGSNRRFNFFNLNWPPQISVTRTPNPASGARPSRFGRVLRFTRWLRRMIMRSQKITRQRDSNRRFHDLELTSVLQPQGPLGEASKSVDQPCFSCGYNNDTLGGFQYLPYDIKWKL
jgi:hypothetical protein